MDSVQERLAAILCPGYVHGVEESIPGEFYCLDKPQDNNPLPWCHGTGRWFWRLVRKCVIAHTIIHTGEGASSIRSASCSDVFCTGLVLVTLTRDIAWDTVIDQGWWLEVSNYDPGHVILLTRSGKGEATGHDAKAILQAIEMAVGKEV